MKPSDGTAHPYEPEPYPLLEAWPEFWWMPDQERNALQESLARKLGGQGLLPRASTRQERER
jgi:hypothetical protein